MKNKSVIKIIIVVVIFVLLFLMVRTDYQMAKLNKPPVFAVKTDIYKDGGTTKYLGLGYTVIDYNIIDGRKDVVFIPFFSRKSSEK